MKHLRLILWLAVLLAWPAFAQIQLGAPNVVVSNLLSLTTVTGTNNGSSFVVNAQLLRAPLFVFDYGAITNAASGSYLTNGITNVLRENIQLSLDNVNFTTLTNWNPADTNGGTANFAPLFYKIPIYIRAQTFTSNAIPVAAKAVLPP